MRLRYKILLYATAITGLIYWTAREAYVIIDTGYLLAYQADSGVDTHLARSVATAYGTEMICGYAIIIVLTVTLLITINKKYRTKR